MVKVGFKAALLALGTIPLFHCIILKADQKYQQFLEALVDGVTSCSTWSQSISSWPSCQEIFPEHESGQFTAQLRIFQWLPMIFRIKSKCLQWHIAALCDLVLVSIFQSISCFFIAECAGWPVLSPPQVLVWWRHILCHLVLFSVSAWLPNWWASVSEAASGFFLTSLMQH